VENDRFEPSFSRSPGWSDSIILSLLAFIGEALVARLSRKKIGSRQISIG